MLLALGIPVAWAMAHFLIRSLPLTLPLFCTSPGQYKLLAVLSIYLLFGFYGASGLFGYGTPSLVLSLLSFCAIPLLLRHRLKRPPEVPIRD